MGFLKDFKEFAIGGNVVELAIAVVIGGAFGAIVKSLIDDVITPLLLKPALDAANLSSIAELKWGAVKYGSFLSSVISFIIIALVVFMIVKGLKKLKLNSAPPPPSATETLLAEIRDALKK